MCPIFSYSLSEKQTSLWTQKTTFHMENIFGEIHLKEMTSLPITPGIAAIVMDDLEDPGNSGFTDGPMGVEQPLNLTRNSLDSSIVGTIFSSDNPLQLEILDFFQRQLSQVKKERRDGPCHKIARVVQEVIEDGKVVTAEVDFTSDTTHEDTGQIEGLNIATKIYHLPPSHSNPSSYEGAKTNLRDLAMSMDMRECILMQTNQIVHIL